jgi:hypothetical protein
MLKRLICMRGIIRELVTRAIDALVIRWCAFKHGKDGIMDMLKILFASKVILGTLTFDQVPRLLKQGVADEIIAAGCPELVPEEYGGTLKTEE